MICDVLKEKNITKYRLSKDSNIPYSTVEDLCTGKTSILKCNVETVYMIAKTLGVSMENLLLPYLVVRPSFDLFKSNICHKLKELGDVDFIIDMLENDEVSKYYNLKWYPESFYILAMIDYLSRVNNIPICEKYNSIRGEKLSQILYPSSVLMLSKTANDDFYKELSVRESIPEFIHFNIVESEIRNVN